MPRGEEIPNPKHQILNSIKAPNANAQKVQDFDIWICLELGFWNLL